MVKEISTVNEFEESIASWHGKGLVVVDYFAQWCGPCKRISPFIATLSGKYPNVLFLKVDVDKVPQISEARNVKSMPTFQYFINGVMVDELIGASEPDLEAKIKKHGVVGTSDIHLNVNDAVQVPVAQLVSAIPSNLATAVTGQAGIPPTGFIHAIIVYPNHERGGITVTFCMGTKVHQLTPERRIINATRGCQYFDLVSDEQIVEIRFHQTNIVLTAVQFVTSHG